MKLIGIIFVIISGILIGYIISLRNSNHIDFLREYIKLISELKTEIKYNQKPLLQILKSYNTNGCLSEKINNCIDLSYKSDLNSAWKLTFSDLYQKYGISMEEENIIKNFASQLGASDVESQQNYCDYNISIIKPYLDKVLEDRDKNEKLPVILGICISLMLSVVIM